MNNRKGGLGKPSMSTEAKEDLLGSVFGESAPVVKGEKAEKTDTAPLASNAKPAKAVKEPRAPKSSEGKAERVGKFFQLDKQLAKQIKIFAIEHDKKEIAVIEEALRYYLKHHA